MDRLLHARPQLSAPANGLFMTITTSRPCRLSSEVSTARTVTCGCLSVCRATHLPRVERVQGRLAGISPKNTGLSPATFAMSCDHRSRPW
jgi:hypothetical protein